tara:strand:+ start:813 stop:1343 length:531 start_codon:yes stop_codon:yes gene_type:complete
VSDIKNKIINGIIKREGGYVDDSRDSGGKTCYGITEKVAREHGFVGHMSDLPKKKAFDIYASEYWHSVRADDLEKVSGQIAEEVVDTAVNMGPTTAGVFLQRSLNALTENELVIDGMIGNKTIKALNDYIVRREDDKVILKALNCLQGSAYIELTERRKKDKAFIYGWLMHRIALD